MPFKGPLIEMDLHHPPCRRFAANQAFYACGQIAQLLLMAMPVSVATRACPETWLATFDPLFDALSGSSGKNRQALSSGLCQEQLQAGLGCCTRPSNWNSVDLSFELTPTPVIGRVAPGRSVPKTGNGCLCRSQALCQHSQEQPKSCEETAALLLNTR